MMGSRNTREMWVGVVADIGTLWESWGHEVELLTSGDV